MSRKSSCDNSDFTVKEHYKQTDFFVSKNTSTEEDVKPTVRLLKIPKSQNGACGFRLTRSKWDPYPWVSAVDVGTPAKVCGLKAGDCILEVNGEDVLGLRITDIAKLVKVKSEHVTLLLWNTGQDAKCDPENLCCAPMPRSLQRLSFIVQSILSIIECPVCLDTITPPAMQCQNGHLLCVNCRIRAEKCPVCRDRYTPRRALIAEHIYTNITNAFNLCRNEDRLRQKIFGTSVKQAKSLNEMHKHNKQQMQVSEKWQHLNPCVEVNKSNGIAAIKPNKTGLPLKKFLRKNSMHKSCSMENLAVPTANATDTKTIATPSMPTLATTNSTTIAAENIPCHNNLSEQMQVYANQMHSMPNPKNQSICAEAQVNSDNMDSAYVSGDITCKSTIIREGATTNSNSSTVSSATNKLNAVNSVSKYFSLSTNDLLHQRQLPSDHQQEQQKPHKEHKEQMFSPEVFTTNYMTYMDNAHSSASLHCLDNEICDKISAKLESKSTPTSTSASLTNSPLPIWYQRRPCTKRQHSLKCLHKRLRPIVADNNNNNDNYNNNMDNSSSSSNNNECSTNDFVDDNSTKAITSTKLSSSSTSSSSSSASSTTCLCCSSCSSSTSGVYTSMDAPFCTAAIKDELLPLKANNVVVTVASLEHLAAVANLSLPSALNFTPTPPATTSSSGASTFQPMTTSPLEFSSMNSPVGKDCTEDMTLKASTLLASSSPSSRLSFTSVEHLQQQYKDSKIAGKNVRGCYYCPCNCGKTFDASQQLQKHVKLVHHLPVLNFGSSSAQLALPLHQPVDNAVIILELNNNDSKNDSITNCNYNSSTTANNNNSNAGQNTCQGVTDVESDKDEDEDESVKIDDKVMAHRNCKSKECWIRIKMLGKDCIQTAALLLGSVAESADFMLETQLSGGNNSNNDAITSTEVINQNTNGIEWQEQQQQQLQQQQQQQQQQLNQQQLLKMRSVVHSMETTTWQAIFNQQYCNNVINNDSSIANNLSSNNNNNFSNEKTAIKNCSHIVSNGKDDYNLSVISVIYLQQQHRKRQQNQQQNGDAAIAGHEEATHAHNLLLNINVRHK